MTNIRVIRSYERIHKLNVHHSLYIINSEPKKKCCQFVVLKDVQGKCIKSNEFLGKTILRLYNISRASGQCRTKIIINISEDFASYRSSRSERLYFYFLDIIIIITCTLYGYLYECFTLSCTHYILPVYLPVSQRLWKNHRYWWRRKIIFFFSFHSVCGLINY